MLYLLFGGAARKERVEVVVEKKHETREKMVSGKNWQTLESFFIFPDTHTYSHKDLFRKKVVIYSTGVKSGDIFGKLL